jgi:hypothetical protein
VRDWTIVTLNTVNESKRSVCFVESTQSTQRQTNESEKGITSEGEKITSESECMRSKGVYADLCREYTKYKE